MCKDNHLLGEFMLDGIPSALKGVPQIEVTFAIDENSILTVTAKEKGSGKKGGITITNEKGRLNKEQIEKMIKDSERHAKSDKIVREKLESKQTLQNYISSMKQTISSDGISGKLGRGDISTIEDNLTDQADWIEANEDASKEDYEDHLKELQSICDPIIAKVYKTERSHHGGGKGEDEEEIDGDL
jgi:molecular chaperone DnaK (HSP70)